MIRPSEPASPGAVARHYDDLDRFYREIWGEHLHHGLFETGREEPQQAAADLVRLVAARGALSPGDRVCDVGCGYGAPARLLAREFGAAVTGITISRAQYEHGRAAATDGVTLVLGDWIENDFAADEFDVVISVEGSEHMPDLGGFFSEAARVLRPGGRMVVATWLAADRPTRRQVRYLLEPICREGRMVGLGNEREYRDHFRRVGVDLTAFDDLSPRVRRTWTVCTRRLVRGFFRRPDYRRFVRDRAEENRVFALTVFRIWAAYRVGALRYGVFTGVKG